MIVGGEARQSIAMLESEGAGGGPDLRPFELVLRHHDAALGTDQAPVAGSGGLVVRDCRAEAHALALRNDIERLATVAGRPGRWNCTGRRCAARGYSRPNQGDE